MASPPKKISLIDFTEIPAGGESWESFAQDFLQEIGFSGNSEDTILNSAEVSAAEYIQYIGSADRR